MFFFGLLLFYWHTLAWQLKPFSGGWKFLANPTATSGSLQVPVQGHILPYTQHHLLCNHQLLSCPLNPLCLLIRLLALHISV